MAYFLAFCLRAGFKFDASLQAASEYRGVNVEGMFANLAAAVPDITIAKALCNLLQDMTFLRGYNPAKITKKWTDPTRVQEVENAMHRVGIKPTAANPDDITLPRLNMMFPFTHIKYLGEGYWPNGKIPIRGLAPFMHTSCVCSITPRDKVWDPLFYAGVMAALQSDALVGKKRTNKITVEQLVSFMSSSRELTRYTDEERIYFLRKRCRFEVDRVPEFFWTISLINKYLSFETVSAWVMILKDIEHRKVMVIRVPPQ
uniref:Nucleoprotein n=1 Tax=Wuhan Millipede Virus 1 TaxID=1608124 RepID=A0A1L3KPN6_9VIRU|nr:nucleoprotein [Wuhan Millipede Virus 1]